MHVLEALKRAAHGTAVPSQQSEFRLLCSGALYNGQIETFDWTKATICRVLLRAPVVLVSASIPADAYPQELALHFGVDEVRQESSGPGGATVTTVFHPHQEVATDLAALLTLLLRRLITVYSHVSVTYPPGSLTRWGLPFDASPMPISGRRIQRAWRERPVSLVRSITEPIKVIGYSVPPLGVDVDWLASMLLALPVAPFARTIVQCARLYAEAMELIEERPAVAYTMLISAAETLAGAALPAYAPPKEEQANSKPKLFKRAIELGISEADATELAALATEGMGWSSRRFREFLMTYTSENIWTQDDLFILSDTWLPQRAHFERALRAVYGSRSASTHSGRGYPSSIGVGTSPMIPLDALHDAWSSQNVPPVTWFERVVQSAAIEYLQTALGVDSARPAVRIGLST